MLGIFQLTFICFAISGPALGSLFETADEEPNYVRFMLPFFQEDNQLAMPMSEEPPVKPTETTDKNSESMIDNLLYMHRDTSLSYNLKYRMKDPDGHSFYRRESSDGSGLVKGYVKFRDENGFPKSIRYSLRIHEHTPSPSLEPSPRPLSKPFQVPHPTEAPVTVQSAHKEDNRGMEDVETMSEREFCERCTTFLTKLFPKLIAFSMDKERNRYEHETTFPPLLFQSAFVPEDSPGQTATGGDSEIVKIQRTVEITFGQDHMEKNSYDSTEGSSSEISNNMIEGSSDHGMTGSSKITDDHSERVAETTNDRFEESSEIENNIQHEESSGKVSSHNAETFEEGNNPKKNALANDLGNEQNEEDHDGIAILNSYISPFKKVLEMKKSMFLQPSSDTNEFNEHNNYIDDKDYKDEDDTIPSKSAFKDSKKSLDLYKKNSAHLPHDHALSHRKFDDEEEEPLYTTQTKPRIRISYHSRGFDKPEEENEPNY
ncbi:hypothetical protein TNIN_85271 [Trichonephila inaurata madagascariensis]|uniref:Uncharacterized protein n=1 Tax=Trichonephila inaurata madagascariensis TaxID=2747483 RepID=A0A8X7C4I8_9ARAC|nr:hypothetical protein TNIN_85271 [Trichonephila inaurata madagascariensis]